MLRFLPVLFLVVACLGCSSDRACVPGAQVACACPGGRPGVQVCRPSGDALGPCTCASAQAVRSRPPDEPLDEPPAWPRPSVPAPPEPAAAPPEPAAAPEPILTDFRLPKETADDVKAKELVDQAAVQFARGQNAHAIRLAQQALKLTRKPGLRSRAIATMALGQCSSGRQADAQATVGHLDGAWRGQVLSGCRSKGVDLK